MPFHRETKTDPKMLQVIAEAVERTKSLSPEQMEVMLKKQREGYVRAEMSWPKPQFEYVNGVKVYASYADYCA